MNRSLRFTLIPAAFAAAALMIVLSRARDEIPVAQSPVISGPHAGLARIPITGLNLQPPSLSNALEQIRAQSQLNMVVRWQDLKSVGVEPSTPLHVGKTGPLSAAAALRLVLDDASPADHDLTWWMEGDVVVVSSADREPVVTRYYNIHPFMAPPGTSPGLTHQEVGDCMIKLLEDTVAPDQWRDAGGTVGSIDARDYVLIVGNTEENHRQIKVRLGQLLGMWPPYPPAEPEP